MKPCPFCGSDDVKFFVTSERYNAGCCMCHNCGARGPVTRGTVERAKNDWNTRHKGFCAGFALMAALIADSYGQPGVVTDAIGETGLTMKDFISDGIAEEDLSTIKEALREDVIDN